MIGTPDWTYHTFLRPIVERLPRRVLRAWGDSRVGRGLIGFFADAPTDPRVGALASDDTRGIVTSLGVGFTRARGPSFADPGDAARELRAKGEVVVDIGAGGPGLPKRVSEATTPRAPGKRRWGFVLLGLGMMAAGLGAAVVAATRVVLPYDEAFAVVPPQMLPFLAHDRMTLAGTMVSIGISYAAIAWSAGGTEWARRAIAISATIGFANFFLFLAYGYFDPLHAAISATLFPFFLAGLRRGDAAAGCANTGVADLANDLAWRRAQWGTLGLVGVGFGLVVGGLAIAAIGSTRVFVASDLEFIGPLAKPPELLALVAHDRAGFGGALVSQGALVMLTAMWGIRRGAAWLWWTFLIAGAVGFGATLAVHLAVGYIDAVHLAPVVLALAIFLASLGLLRGYMLAEGASATEA